MFPSHALFLIVSFYLLTFCVARSPPNIAIVGGGIGGTSCAYFLNELFQGKADITLYERDIIGGRLNLVNIDGHKYEAGGAVIHPRNKYMVEFSNLLGLGMKKPPSTKFGIYDGEKFVIEESEWYLVTMAKFFWRYGVSIFELFKDVKWMLDEFSRERFRGDTLLQKIHRSFKSMIMMLLLTLLILLGSCFISNC